ncbi:MAG TPA: OB-fold nucleic acid binding domain-containing protein, partial [Oscillospiraceae bacterium]|nr:OB-fold nucleic acid binding domain-containing protein [Oscillospiraceae bacterium]
MEEELNQELTEAQLSELLQIRRDKLDALRSEGKDPFVLTKYPVDAYAGAVRENFSDAEEGAGEAAEDADNAPRVHLAGRIMSKRGMGKASFADLQDTTGRIQLYIRKDAVGDETYADFKKWDIGDIIGVEGVVFRTHAGEISVRAEKITLLAKSLLPLPEKFHGLKDPELRYRQRYVDLIVNPEVKDTFIKRSQIIREIRAMLDEEGFLEVETPVLNTIPGGAAARP